jgi:hypothetical protein
MPIRTFVMAAAMAAGLAGLAAGGAPGAALAQGLDRTDSLVDEVAAFERDVADGIATEALSRKDGTYLRGRARAIRTFFNKISRDGVSLAEAQLVRDRITYLRTRYGVAAQTMQ